MPERTSPSNPSCSPTEHPPTNLFFAFSIQCRSFAEEAFPATASPTESRLLWELCFLREFHLISCKACKGSLIRSKFARLVRNCLLFPSRIQRHPPLLPQTCLVPDGMTEDKQLVAPVGVLGGLRGPSLQLSADHRGLATRHGFSRSRNLSCFHGKSIR